MAEYDLGVDSRSEQFKDKIRTKVLSGLMNAACILGRRRLGVLAEQVEITDASWRQFCGAVIVTDVMVPVSFKNTQNLSGDSVRDFLGRVQERHAESKGSGGVKGSIDMNGTLTPCSLSMKGSLERNYAGSRSSTSNEETVEWTEIKPNTRVVEIETIFIHTVTCTVIVDEYASVEVRPGNRRNTGANVGTAVGVIGGGATGTGAGAGVGAGIGAVVGTLALPLIGTAIGTGVGAGIGAIFGGISGAIAGTTTGGIAGRMGGRKIAKVIEKKEIIRLYADDVLKSHGHGFYIEGNKAIVTVCIEMPCRIVIKSILPENYYLTTTSS